VYCPTLFLPRKGTCISIAYHPKVAYTINVEVLPDDPSNLSFFYEEEHVKTVTSFVLGYFGLRRCRVCLVQVFATNNNTAVIRYHLHTSDKCKYNRIMMAVNMKTDYSSRFPLEIRGHTFYVNFDQYKESDSLYKLDEYGQRGCIAFPAHRGYNCPRLWLNHTELEHVHNTHTSPSSLLYYLKDDRGSFVCLDNYIFINKGTDLNNNLSFISFGIICYVYFI